MLEDLTIVFTFQRVSSSLPNPDRSSDPVGPIPVGPGDFLQRVKRPGREGKPLTFR